MIDENTLSEQDIQLFRVHLRGVRPLKKQFTLKGEKTTPVFNTVKLPSPFTHSKETRPMADSFKLYQEEDNIFPTCFRVKPEDSLFFARSGIQNQRIKKLKKAQLTILDTLDLHGMNQAEAVDAMKKLLEMNMQGGCLCIIHGKGDERAILKNLTNNFLRQSSKILAFCSTPKHLGGTGAVLALIRSTKGTVL